MNPNPALMSELTRVNQLVAEGHDGPSAWRKVRQMADPPSLDARNDPPGVGPVPAPIGAATPVTVAAPPVWAFPELGQLRLQSAADVRAALAGFGSIKATDTARSAAWARIVAAGAQYGVVVPPSWSGATTLAEPVVVHGPGVAALVADRATSSAAALVPAPPAKASMSEAQAAALKLGEGRRFEVGREREDVHKAALIVMANRGQRVDTATSSDPAERMKFGENYAAALRDVSDAMGGLG
jgi:hypothetical protein